MGRKKVAFVEKKNAKRMRLVPNSGGGPSGGQSERKELTAEELEEQHKHGIYFDDDYDYMQHLRDINPTLTLQAQEEEEEEMMEKTVIRVPKKTSTFPGFPPGFLDGESSSKIKADDDVFDEDIEKALEGNFDNVAGGLEDDFIALAGGLPDGSYGGLMRHREKRRQEGDSDEDEEEEEEDEEFDDDMFEDEEDGMGEEMTVHRDGPQRDIDNAFDKMLEEDYHDEQLGELDGDDEKVAGYLEPDDGRIRRIMQERPRTTEYDEQLAKDYVKQRMKLYESGQLKEETEIVEVDVEESARKRMKWDCESFASEYTNIYNHPTIIKDSNAKISRRGLKKLNRETAKLDAMEEGSDEEEDEDDDMSQCTAISTIRPKGETPEERRLRKQAVKEAKRFRRQEKKANKVAFGEEHRKLAKSRFGQVKSKTIL